jgi:hypothetical protein
VDASATPHPLECKGKFKMQVSNRLSAIAALNARIDAFIAKGTKSARASARKLTKERDALQNEQNEAFSAGIEQYRSASALPNGWTHIEADDAAQVDASDAQQDVSDACDAQQDAQDARERAADAAQVDASETAQYAFVAALRAYVANPDEATCSAAIEAFAVLPLGTARALCTTDAEAEACDAFDEVCACRAEPRDEDAQVDASDAQQDGAQVDASDAQQDGAQVDASDAQQDGAQVDASAPLQDAHVIERAAFADDVIEASIRRNPSLFGLPGAGDADAVARDEAAEAAGETEEEREERVGAECTALVLHERAEAAAQVDASDAEAAAQVDASDEEHDGETEEERAARVEAEAAADAQVDASDAKKRAKGKAANSAGVAASWLAYDKDGVSIRSKRLKKDGCTVVVEGETFGTEFPSTAEAFRYFRIPLTKCIKFRLGLKTTRRGVFEYDGVTYYFAM